MFGSDYPVPQRRISEERNNFCVYASLLSGIFHPSMNCYMRVDIYSRVRKIKKEKLQYIAAFRMSIVFAVEMV